jgi:hypothetical protein
MSNRKKLKPLKRQQNLSESEWLEELRFIANESSHVIDIFHILEEIIRLGKDTEAGFDVLNADSLFWRVHTDCLQESMFMGLGRLCDSSTDAINVHRVLKTAILHPEFFTKKALTQRMKAQSISEQFLNQMLGKAWIPTDSSDWKQLRKAANVHLSRIEQIYRPIRDSHYGHRLTHADINEMFAKTNRNQLSDTLDAMHELVTGLNDLYERGIKPEIRSRDLDLHNNQIKGYARAVIEKLAGKKL